jgi:Calcineurin-like phosphoesterase
VKLPVTLVPHWSELAAMLRDERSVVSHAARHSLQPNVFKFLRSSFRDLGATNVVSIQPDECIQGARIDWQRCLDMFALQFGEAAATCSGAIEFRERLLTWIERDADIRLLVVIGIGTASSVEGRFELISAIHYCLSNVERQSALRVAVLDDYSLYYYEWWRTQGVSRWDYLHRLHLRPMDEEDIRCALSVVLPDTSEDTRIAISSEVERATGGHVALVIELLDDIVRRNGAIPSSYWQKVVPSHLASTHTIESIRRSLQEDQRGFSERALEYEKPKAARDANSPTVQALRSLGVLQWTTLAAARLCPGTIGDVVKEIKKRADDDDVVGSVLSDAGQRFFVPQSLLVLNDDITILHISDIHVGEPYAFRMNAGSARHDRRSAAEMLADDLKSSNINHVDAVVFSGDFTQTADSSEFRRAKEVLTDVLEVAGLGWDRAIVTAGNHDVRWNPPPTAVTDPETGVSREEFCSFREQAGKIRETLADVHLIVSRSGKAAIRIVALDSNVVEGPAAGGIGYVSTATLQAAQSQLAALAVPRSIERLATWVVVHHHVFPVTSALVVEAQKRKVSVMANAAMLLSFVSEWGAEMILHGHEHQPSLTIARRWPVERGRDLAPLCVAGAGSFGCKREYLGPFARNHYFVHVRRERDILVRSRMTGDEGLGWVAHEDLSIPIALPASPAAATP